MKISRSIMFVIILLIVSLSSYSFATPSSPQKSLNTINTKIKRVATHIKKTKSQRKQVLQQLQSIEVTMGDIIPEINVYKKNIHHQKQIINQLNKKIKRLALKLAIGKSELGKQLQTAYMTGNQSYLKVILNQQQPANFDRMLHYYQYLNQASLKRINVYMQNLVTLKQLQNKANQHMQLLVALQEKQKQQLTVLNLEQQQRQKIIGKLSQEITSQRSDLAMLQHNKSALQNVIDQISIKQFQAKHVITTPNKISSQRPNHFTMPFHRLRKHLPWPTHGDIIAHFGNTIANSNLTYSGILIQAPLGQPVRAISNGHVVFAHWLRGYGLLLIIDHGHGYLTLYGRNQALYVKPGNWVKRGAVIATVGISGGYRKPALYFAIRHHSVALNPMRWCTTSAQS